MADVTRRQWEIYRWQRLKIKVLQRQIMDLGPDLLLAPFEQFEKLMSSNELRRNAALHEIDYYRRSFGQKVRAALQIDAEASPVLIEAPPGQKEPPH